MKLLIIMFLLTLLGACTKTVDGSSPAKFKESIKTMSKDMPEDKLILLEGCLKKAALNNLNDMESMYRKLDGKSAQEIIDYELTKDEQFEIISVRIRFVLKEIGLQTALQFTNGLNTKFTKSILSEVLQKWNMKLSKSKESLEWVSKNVNYLPKVGDPYTGDPKIPVATYQYLGKLFTVHQDGAVKITDI